MFAKLLLLLVVTEIARASNVLFLEKRFEHKPQKLRKEQKAYVASLSDPEYTEIVLDNILIPRAVGTANHYKVRNYIINELKNLGYSVEIDAFEDQIPNAKNVSFKNIVAPLDPNAKRFLVLACHYDTKMFPKDYVGAIDGAVPCAMLLNLAKVMKDLLDKSVGRELSLLLIFFDGEEPFEEWAEDDSLYGSRHLARRWEKQLSVTSEGEVITFLDRINVFVLLNQIGAANQTFVSNFPKTTKIYARLANAEEKLSKRKLLKTSSKTKRHFKRMSAISTAQDDHTPFLKKGVPVLLVMSEQEDHWHEENDDRTSIDMDTIEDLNKIFRVFVTEYLHLLPKPESILH